MSLKRKKWIWFLILPFIVAVFLCLWGIKELPASNVRMESTNGYWDLSSFDFSEDNALIAGSVEYIPEKLLTPEQFDAENITVIGHPENVSAYSTSRIRLSLPDGEYLLAGHSIDFSDILYVNGKKVLTVGTPGADKASSDPDARFFSIPVRPIDGALEIVQQTSNFAHRGNSSHANLFIGTAENINRYVSGRMWSEILMMGCYLALFFVHLILFVIQRTYKNNLYLALLCLVWFCRTGVTGLKMLRVILPAFSWSMGLRMEYMVLPLTCLLVILILYNLFPGIMQRWAVIAASSLSGLFIILFAFIDTLIMSYMLNFVYVLIALAAIYLIVRLIQKLRKVNTEQVIVLSAFVFLVVAYVNDMLYYSNTPLSFFGIAVSEATMLIFMLFTMTAMLVGTMKSVQQAQEREQELTIENQALERAGALRNEMTATISHEMRTPLTVMSAYAQFIVETIRDGKVDEQTTADLTTISDEAKRLAGMATDLLHFAQTQEREKEKVPLEIPSILRQTARLCQPMIEKGKNELVLDIPMRTPKVLGQTGSITQLTWNLLSNAAAHTEDGVITITVRQIKENLLLIFADTGSGIAVELFPHLFDKDYKTGKSGNGLGLPICKEIAEQHGGSIKIDSAPGKGTRVIVTLPIYEGDRSDA